VATDTRLWLYGALGQTRGYLADLIKAAVARAEADVDVLMPGFTHLQPAQARTGSRADRVDKIYCFPSSTSL
jgi:argininosuccinate lyase